jgi:hypothetical protein
MLKNFVLKNVAAVMAAGGVLALTQIAGPALVSSAPSFTKSAYPASVVTKTDLRLDRNRVRPGQKNTARITVTADKGTPKGTVTLTVQGRSPRTKALVNGRVSFAMPRHLKAGRTYRVTARYNGKRIWKPSRDTAFVTVKKRGGGQVLGEEGSRNGGGSANRGAPTDGGAVAGSEAQGGLPGVGADSTTQLYALGGLGLLAAGAFSLLMYRRRVRG